MFQGGAHYRTPRATPEPKDFLSHVRGVLQRRQKHPYPIILGYSLLGHSYISLSAPR